MLASVTDLHVSLLTWFVQFTGFRAKLKELGFLQHGLLPLLLIQVIEQATADTGPKHFEPGHTRSLPLDCKVQSSSMMDVDDEPVSAYASNNHEFSKQLFRLLHQVVDTSLKTQGLCASLLACAK